MRFAILSLLALASAILAQIPQQAPLPGQAPTLTVALPQAPAEEPEPPETLKMPAAEPRPWLSPLPFPEGAKRFVSAKHTQSIYILNDGFARYHRIDHAPISALEEKWQVSGGMVGVKGWKSDKYRTLPAGGKVETWTDFIEVKNSHGFMQKNKGILRKYPDGTRFDDVLSKDGVVFEHRVRTKADGRWKSEVAYEDKGARPAGYNGLSVSCASCHSQAGSGNYGVGLVPGSDSILSDPLDWKAVWVIEPVE